MFSSASVGQQFTILLTQDGTGSRTVTWPSGITWNGNPSGSAPTLQTAANAVDTITFKCTGSGAYLGYPMSASGGGSGTVTSITAGTGLTGGTITTSGTIALANPSASTLGGVESIASVSHNFLTSISTSGVPAQAQPAFTDISGSATLAQFPTEANNTVLGNVSGSTAVPVALTAAFRMFSLLHYKA